MSISETVRVARLHGEGDLRVETIAITPPAAGEVQVAIAAGGICGSDLHYFQHGGFGPVRVREPIILGHEASGHVIALGAGVEGLSPGDLVAVNPSHPCGKCRFCHEGVFQHCLNMTFLGSAMYLPHAQGLFRERVNVAAGQAVRVTGDVSPAEAACSEPLAVCLHAAKQAGEISGRRVLVTGAGPIGVLCAAVAAAAGAAEIVVTDLEDHPLKAAAGMGASRTLNIRREAAEMEQYTRYKGYFDIAFECSAAAPAINQAITTLRPQGTLVQVGVGGETPLPLNLLVGKEIRFHGSHRFHEEFAEAVAAISSRRIDVRPMITPSMPLADAAEAMQIAGDRTRAVKLHLSPG